MLNIFYQNNTLNDTLIINVSLQQANKINTKSDVTIGYKDKEVVFVNIANAKKHFNDLVVDGLLFPTKELMNAIEKICELDLLPHFDNGFKIAEVVKCEDIQGTHLHKTEVSVGDKVLKIVCGAPNCKQGLKVVCATNGTMLPDGKTIIEGQLLGTVSQGMLCSYRELGIDQPNAPKGIIELDYKYKTGDYFKQAYINETNK